MLLSFWSVNVYISVVTIARYGIQGRHMLNRVVIHILRLKAIAGADLGYRVGGYYMSECVGLILYTKRGQFSDPFAAVRNHCHCTARLVWQQL